MNKPDLMNTQREKNARRIYYGAYLRVLGIGFLIYFSVVFSIIWGINFLFPGFLDDNFHYVGGLIAGYVSVMSTAQGRGMHALREAGLLDEEDVPIERTSDNACGGPTLEIHSSLWGKWIIICSCLLLCAALVWIIFISSDSRLFQVACFVMAIVMGGIAVLVLVNRKQPEVRLDDRGIFVCSAGLDKKLVPWSVIARARFQRIASAPNIVLFSFLETDTSEIISLEAGDGKSLLVLNNGVFSGSPAIKARFIAELERRLTAATSPQGEENFDD